MNEEGYYYSIVNADNTNVHTIIHKNITAKSDMRNHNNYNTHHQQLISLEKRSIYYYQATQNQKGQQNTLPRR